MLIVYDTPQVLMYNIEAVATNIRNARLYRNYSQDYLARKLNISQNAYSKLECGYTRVTIEKLNIIAAVLQVDITTLIEIDDIRADIEAINRIAIVPVLLELICRTTGMGFAAIARVTEDKWVTCQVHDEINFGLKPGDELKLETTICYEIRQSGKAVIIDEVAKDEIFCQHPTPAMYGFQSYISVPIIRQDGTFFGTLCAIDPKPAKVNNPETIALFKMYADLISVHLNAVEQMVFAEVNMISKQRSIAPAAVIIVNKPAIYNPSTEKVTPIWSGLDALSSINIPA